LHVQTASGGDVEAKPTAITVADKGTWVRRQELAAGGIGRLWGLGEVRIGDILGQPTTAAAQQHFAPPTMETIVAPVRPADERPLRAALARLAEQDPLINVRVDATGRELSVSLYGEVQKEVIQATLADGYGIDVTFRETTTIHIERPVGTGAAAEFIGTAPFHATVGLRIEPAPVGSGPVMWYASEVMP